ncbi:MAG: PQQ-binding-like beta-propeller repeat protein [Phycisphaerales bacterium]
MVYNVGKHGLALHASDGTLAWMTGTDVSGYSTPVPLDDNGQQLLVVMGYRTFAAVEPLTGSVMWEYSWVNGLPGNIADPVVDGNELFVSSGYNKGSGLFRVSGGQVAQVWLQRNMQTCYNTAVLWQGYLYGPNDSGSNLTCLEFSTGEVIWNQGGFGRACVTLADGSLIVLSETGVLSVGEASPEGYVPAVRAQILSGECRSVPVLANGKIYVRSTAGNLACVELTTSAPRVDAGSSVLTWLKADETTVVLNGSVADDTNDVTSISWSVLSSPDGSLVEFADTSKPATTASFTQTGVYVLELRAIDAESQEGYDRIEVRVYADADEAAKNCPAGSSVAAWHDSDADGVEDPNEVSLTEDVYYDAGTITLPANEPQENR